ncbi:MAG: alkaline phosphatase family protein [Actinomycetota bacterium]|nr:alkaline phosphatase family protein [Actinomycetota bacterium]
MGVKLVILGWDSATFEVVDPLIEQGRLPNLERLVNGGWRAPLRSVWPPMTDCAWTSAFTGVNPARHGIFGSWYRAPGRYACRYFSSRDRKAPALWELSKASRFLVWNVPMAYPPTDVEGAMVSGYGAPPGAVISKPPSLHQEIEERWRLEDLLDRAPHSTLERFLDDLVRGLEVQAESVPWAASRAGADCVVVVWPHVDRAQHFFWKFRGSDHPLGGAVERVYEAMDRATGAVVEAFDRANVIVVSDHGAGDLNGDVNVGAWLAAHDFAEYGRPKSNRLLDMVWKLPPPIRRLGRRVAPGTARRAFGATLSGQLGSFDWSKTKAFVGFHGDLWLNLSSREPQGIVGNDERDDLLETIRHDLLELTDPATEAPVFSDAFHRDQIYEGPEVDLAPDLMLDSWSAGYRIAPAREKSDRLVMDPANLAGVEEAWSSDHRPVGVFVAAGPDISKGASDELSLMDLCPTALALLNERVPSDLDGRAATEILTESFLNDHEIRIEGRAGGREESGEYSDEEAAAVAAHLKDLGYIE